MPAHAVLLLCWNHEAFLETCIASLASQSEKDFEVIFLDNKSSDGSVALARRLLAAADLPHQIMVNDAPANIATNINRMFAKSSAPLVSFLSTDDYYSPDYIKEMQAAWRAHPEAGLFYADGWTYWDEEQRLERINSASHVSGHFLPQLLTGRDSFFFVGTCVPRKIFKEIGGFDESLRIDDLDFFIRIARNHPFQRVDAPLVTYRKSREAVSADSRFMIAGWEQYHRKYRGADFWDVDAWMAERYRQHAAISVDAGDYRLAASLVAKSLRLRPFSVETHRTASYLLRRSVSALLGR